jgi:hypothetical protein
VSIGSASPNLSWTPTDQDFDVTLLAASGGSTSDPLTVSVAEANRIATDLSTWSRTSINAPTSGQPDPLGGTAAYRFTFPAATASHNISKAMSPVSAVFDSGFEIWAAYDATMPVIMIYPLNTDTSEYCGINLLTGDKVGNFADACIVQSATSSDGKLWRRVQFKRGKGTFTTSTVAIYFKKTLANPLTTSETTDGSEGISLFFPRSADGVLPFTDFDKFQRFSLGTVTVPTTAQNPYTYDCQRWESRSPFVDRRLDMNANRGHIDVVLPDTYDANRAAPYPVLYVLEVENAPGTAFQDGLGAVKATGAHNTYDCILVRTKFSGSIAATPWYGNRGNDTHQHNKHMACLRLFMQEKFNTSTSREYHRALGFSKSGWGAMSLMLRDQLFGYLAAWDVPWTLTYGGTDYGQAAYFGSQAQYQLFNPQDIFDSYLPSVNDKARIVLAGSATFDADTVNMEAFLNTRSIPHTYVRNVLGGGGADHNWGTGWLPSVLAALFALS